MTSVNNIVLPTSGSCPFCAFLRGEKPYTILRRSELVAILVTREQRGVSHLLVVPVRHCPTILDLRDEESGALMTEIRQAARIVDAAERRPGIAVWQNNGITANQAVAHVHFHVAGTLEEGGTMWGEVPKLSVTETDAIAERLRQVEASLRHLTGADKSLGSPGRLNGVSGGPGEVPASRRGGPLEGGSGELVDLPPGVLLEAVLVPAFWAVVTRTSGLRRLARLARLPPWRTARLQPCRPTGPA